MNSEVFWKEKLRELLEDYWEGKVSRRLYDDKKDWILDKIIEVRQKEIEERNSDGE